MNDHGSGRTNAANQSPDWDAIARFLADESPAEEAERVRAWLAANPGDRRLVERLDEAARPSLADVDVESALRRVHSRMQAQPETPRLTLQRGNASRWGRTFMIPVLLAAAAVVAVVVVRRAPTND